MMECMQYSLAHFHRRIVPHTHSCPKRRVCAPGQICRQHQGLALYFLVNRLACILDNSWPCDNQPTPHSASPSHHITPRGCSKRSNLLPARYPAPLTPSLTPPSPLHLTHPLTHPHPRTTFGHQVVFVTTTPYDMPLTNGTPPRPAGINMSCVIQYNAIAR